VRRAGVFLGVGSLVSGVDVLRAACAILKSRPFNAVNEFRDSVIVIEKSSSY
jgi:hypothetical protein